MNEIHKAGEHHYVAEVGPYDQIINVGKKKINTSEESYKILRRSTGVVII